MKISHNTPELLMLDHVPWLIGAGMIFMIVTFSGIGMALIATGVWAGLVFIGFCAIPLVILAAFTARIQVIFDRPGGQVTLRRRDFRGYCEEQIPLSSVHHAEVERRESRDRDGDRSVTYRPVLSLYNGETRPLVRIYSNQRSIGRMVDTVNDWLTQ